MIRNYSISFIFLIIAFASFAQAKPVNATWETATKDETLKAIDKAVSWFAKTPMYEVKVTYSSFVNYTINTPTDKSEGYYKRNGNNFNSHIMGTHTIQNDRMKILVDTANQIIVINNKSNISDMPVDTSSVSKMLENVKSIKKQKNESGLIVFKIEFKPNSMYSFYEFSINEKGLFKYVKYYYSQELIEDEEDENSIKGKPRIEIFYSSYNSNVKLFTEADFSEKLYFKEENKKIILNTNYKNFEVKDYRYAVKK